MHILIIQIHVKPEYIEEFQAATLVNANATAKEPGCVRFDVLQQADDPTRFVFSEVYRDAAQHAAHRETEHYKTWAEAATPMLAEPRTRAVYRNVHPQDDAF